MAKTWNGETLMEMVRGFQPACVVVAAAELDLFSAVHKNPGSASELADKINGDLRATTILLDALASMGILLKRDGRYNLQPALVDVLTEGGKARQLSMIQHLGNCLRRWSRLADTVRDGRRPALPPSIRGEAGDLESFIQAMHEISTPAAGPLARTLADIPFTHFLDIGGATGTWTIAFLANQPAAKATIFDLPAVIPMAEARMKQAGLAGRVSLAAGDFYVDPLPEGADLAWLGAIIHQNSPKQNRELYARILTALAPGGQLLIRDIVMDGSHTAPAAGALFAVNMLVGTAQGGTYSFGEISDDLKSAGFTNIRLLRHTDAMDSIVAAAKPK